MSAAVHLPHAKMTATPRTKIAEIMIMTAQRADKSISSAPLKNAKNPIYNFPNPKKEISLFFVP